MIFDELLTPPTNEELGIYWLRATRSDGLGVTLSFSLYERYVGVLVTNDSDVAFTSINMKNCSEIRVLDEKKKILEIIHDDMSGRCFLDLAGERISHYEEYPSI